MRVLIAHNRYQQKGGEDTVVAAEDQLLQSRGHEVYRLDTDNDHIHGLVSQIQTATRSVYSLRAKRHMREVIGSFRPDIVHVHNFFPTLSPAVFIACAEAGVPVVHTLHNFRLLCAASTLYRDGHVCEDCITDRSFLPGVRHACYRHSRFGSAVLGFGMALHAQLGTWSSRVSAFIALTDFAADKIGGARVPRNKIFVKPNFVQDRGVGEGQAHFALFVGRLSPEKGLQTLMEADRENRLCMDVMVIGDGPLRPDLERAAARPGSRLRLKGFAAPEQIIACMKEARVLLIPSVWYEGQPMVFIEALSVGLPVIATDLGGFSAELASRGAGLTYPAGDARALGDTLARFCGGGDVAAFRHGARSYFLAEFTPELNYQRLMEIYDHAAAARIRPASPDSTAAN